eukprot:Plantae.Rhodophyta-Palmaria_palmata.ctg16630.p1 GENE.Plantae.Rhodophyta-Palmaria_palmata.ctg16630~~Plantae.Rhodophyta-Palmaria_palmata.ctg16630.p1  ORF type:complete len:148 (-),score=20.84 Plantae.Rhodophyta-Palmaria_palmata.ctg16630:164-607(-)
MAVPRLAARGTLLYLGAVNVGGAALFGYDKMQAQSGGWRVSEADLCKTALYGGWLGGLLAMQAFRHKTRKESFQEKYASAVAKNAAAGGAALAVATRSPAYRQAFMCGARSALLFISNVIAKSSSSSKGGGGRHGGGRLPRPPRRLF